MPCAPCIYSGGFFGAGTVAFGRGAARVGSEAFAARFMAAASARASSALNVVRNAMNAVSVTSRTIVVSVAVIIRVRDIEPAVTPGPVTEASQVVESPRRRGRAERMRAAESDQRRRSVAISVIAIDVRASAAPTESNPWPRVRTSNARSLYN